MSKIKLTLTLYMMLICLYPGRLYAGEISQITSDNRISEDHGEILWIDRMEHLPAYARRFYDWLVANRGADGAFADFSKVEKQDSEYRHLVRTITDTVTVSVAGVSDVRSRVYDVIDGICREDFEDTVGFIDGAFYAFQHDYPEMFWLKNRLWRSWSSEWEYYVEGNNCRVTYTQYIYFVLKDDGYNIRTEEYLESDKIKQDMQALEEAMTEILASCEGMSDYEKLRSFNQWLIKRNQYNTTEDLDTIPASCRAAISAMSGRLGELGPVCSGYAKAFQMLCDRAGIPCISVVGDGFSGESEEGERHEWNMVRMPDGAWYAVDVTWNDQEFYNEEISWKYEHLMEDYFLVGADTEIYGIRFSDSHIADNAVYHNDLTSYFFKNAPILAKEAYALPKEEMNGIWNRNGIYCYLDNGQVDESKNGLVYSPSHQNWIYLDNGYWNEAKNCVTCFEDQFVYVENGMRDAEWDGIYAVDEVWYYFKDGAHDMSFRGFYSQNGRNYYFWNGVSNTDFSAIAEMGDAHFPVVHGKGVKGSVILSLIKGPIYYLRDGEFQENYTGPLACRGEVLYIEKGIVNQRFSGIIEHENRQLLVQKGRIREEYTGMYRDHAKNWYYILNGRVAKSYKASED